ncbi:MAG: tetratricopeptide repeat protein [Planctomycetota bacterium]|jgi:Tfp pilus assembly protein PilF
MRKKPKVLIWKVFIISTVQLLLSVAVATGQRRIGIGERIPEFSATDIDEKVFEYKHGGGKALMVVFLSGRKRSDRAAVDITRIISKLGAGVKHLDVAVAVDEPNTGRIFQSKSKESVPGLRIFLDNKYRLWGKFGIIVTPTVIISDTNDTVLWVEAGYGSDFAPVIQARLNQALGVAQEIDPNDAGKVKTVHNTTVAARIKRHLQMAKILWQKGRHKMAVSEIKKAKEMDPNSVEIRLELGEFLCGINQSKEALEVIDKIQTIKVTEKARALLITGWAKRQMGELDEAEGLLREATKLDSKSSRGFFELGKVYQAKGEVEKAMNAYYSALSLVFSEKAGTNLSHQ